MTARSSGISDFDHEQLMLEAEHLNDEHSDTVSFVARFGAGWPEVSTATIVDVDESGVVFEVEHGGRTERRRFQFGFEATTLEEVRASMQALLLEARNSAPEAAPLTSLEREIAEVADLPTFHTTVTKVTDLTPRMRAITFGGGLDEYPPLAPDQFLLVTLPGQDPPAQAYYTVRRWRPREGEIDMWFVVHDHHGPLSGWASQARIGDQVALWGPRSSFDPPADTEALLLVADDTALPAIAAILEQTELPARVVIETFDPAHSVSLEPRSDVDVKWVYRRGDEAGTGGRLLHAVEKIDLSTSGLYAFGGAESREITAVRRHLRQNRGLSREQVQMTGYWRRQAPAANTQETRREQ